MPKRAHHHVGIEHMIPMALMAAKVKEAVAARRNPDFLVIARTNAMRASTMDDALRRGEAYREAGADVVLLSMVHEPERLRAIAERLGGPLMYLMDWSAIERDLLATIDIDKLLAVERATVEQGKD